MYLLINKCGNIMYFIILTFIFIICQSTNIDIEDEFSVFGSDIIRSAKLSKLLADTNNMYHRLNDECDYLLSVRQGGVGNGLLIIMPDIINYVTFLANLPTNKFDRSLMNFSKYIEGLKLGNAYDHFGQQFCWDQANKISYELIQNMSIILKIIGEGSPKCGYQFNEFIINTHIPIFVETCTQEYNKIYAKVWIQDEYIFQRDV